MTTIKPAFELATRVVAARRTEALFQSTGGYRAGHFLLWGGRHADALVAMAPVLADPAVTSELCGFWSARLRGSGRDAERPLVDVIVGPTPGGAILAFETARQLGVRTAFAEPAGDADGRAGRAFPPGVTITRGDRVLIVDDVLARGGAMRSMVAAVEAVGGEIVECDVVVDHGDGRAVLTSPATGRTYPLRALWRPDLPRFDPGEAMCPRCAHGDPLELAGSVGSAAPDRS